MRKVSESIFVSARLRRDAEAKRWYSEGATACVALTSRGRLLEPHPIFGPTSYRLIARRVSVAEASLYARRHGLLYERVAP